MIVIDESIQDNRIIRSIGDWYPGQVISIIALQLTQLQVKQETSVWLRKLLLLPEFRTKAARMGWIVYARSSRIEYYTTDGQIRYLSWPT